MQPGVADEALGRTASAPTSRFPAASSSRGPTEQALFREGALRTSRRAPLSKRQPSASHKIRLSSLVRRRAPCLSRPNAGVSLVTGQWEGSVNPSDRIQPGMNNEALGSRADIVKRVD